MNRREFLAASGAGSAWLAGRGERRLEQPENRPADQRAAWVRILRRLADPVLTSLANGTLKQRMPVEQAPNASNRPAVTHLEALGRLLDGIAPWLELPADDTEEGRLRAQYGELARRAIAGAVDPASPDFLNFTEHRQPLVDAAFLAQALLRAPRALLGALEAGTRKQLIAALESTRVIVPNYNNWLLFTASVEAGLKALGASWDRLRVDYALRQHEQWYLGDGTYGDGPELHWDYYNSFVIQPMLLDVLDACGNDAEAWKAMIEPVRERARRYAAVQERLIAPDGSYPPIGRSIAYRCGAFQLLAHVALRRMLPSGVSPAQVRGALSAVITRTLEAPNTFDENGWLRIGLGGHQPMVGESYISTGSLYLCSFALLPLGLPPTDEFWSAPPQPWTQARAWAGDPFPIDKALYGKDD
jgi:hypothetical protein